jgi:hypothetical protein
MTRPHVHSALVALLIFATATLVWLTRDQAMEAKRQPLAAARARLEELTSRSEASRAVIEEVRSELAAAREKQLGTLVKVKHAEQDLERPQRDDKWSEAPPSGPEWKRESPYVWLSKATLSGLSSNPFQTSGALRKEFADALAISEGQRQRVSQALTAIVNEFQSLQVAHAERTVTPPSRDGESAKITVRIPALPEDSARLKAQVATALEMELGTQRKDLLMALGRHVIDSKLNAFGKREEKIGAKRLAHGGYEIWVGDGMMSGPPRLDDHIPAHLLPFFAEIQPHETADTAR